MKKFVFAVAILLAGCDDFRPKMKCVDGVLYARDNGAWVQVIIYKENKCLPEETK